MARRALVAALCAVIVLSGSGAASAGWRQRIDEAIGGRSVGVSVRLRGERIYSHADRERRVPASNQKLLMSMALLDERSHRSRLPTFATVVPGTLDAGVIRGDLWLLGRGDPSVTDGGRFVRSLSFVPTRLSKLARRIKEAGVTRITGRVIGSTGYFAHDWFATGWKPHFPSEEVPMPTALTFSGNRTKDFHFADPERRAAAGLTGRLRDLGIRIGGQAEQGEAPDGLRKIATVRSRSLDRLLKYTNRRSSNFFAEVLGKRLGVETYGAPGTIAKGARAITALRRESGRGARGARLVRAVVLQQGLASRNRKAPGFRAAGAVGPRATQDSSERGPRDTQGAAP